MNDDGRGELEAHLPAIQPPAELRVRVRASLSMTAGSASPPVRSAFARWSAAAGLLAAGFVLGVLVRDRVPAAAQETAAPGQYVVLLYGHAPDDTGAVHTAREREYGQWARALGSGVRWVGGSELHDVVAELGPAGPVRDASSDRLAGYFVIEAPSRERATEVAKTCPHIKYGGRIVVMTVAS